MLSFIENWLMCSVHYEIIEIFSENLYQLFYKQFFLDFIIFKISSSVGK